MTGQVDKIAESIQLNNVPLSRICKDNMGDLDWMSRGQAREKGARQSHNRTKKSSSIRLIKEQSTSRSPKYFDSPFDDLECNPNKLLTNEKSVKKRQHSRHLRGDGRLLE